MKLKSFIFSCLRGSGQVLFQSSPVSGALFLLALFVGSWSVGLSALCGLLVVTTIATYFRSQSGALENGLYGYNGVLVGAMAAAFLEKNFIAVCMLASIVAIFFQLIIEKYFTRLPLLTFPFVIISWITLAILPMSPGTTVQIPGTFLFFHNVSQVFLLGNSVSGILILAGLLVGSRKAFTWTVVASFLTILLSALLNIHVLGFSAVLTCIALGSVFEQKASMTVLAILLTILVQILLNITLGLAQLPALTSPFILVVWLFLLKSGVKTFDSK